MTNPVNSAITSSVAATSDAAAAGANNAVMGKDQFLKLLLTQIRYQDPTKPMDDSAFVTQLAQFTSLEQAMGTNERLELLALQQKGMANTEVAVLVGKNVTLKGSSVQLDGQGLGTPIGFSLGEAASSVKVHVKDASGRTVRTMDLGQQVAGTGKTQWDGKDNNGVAQPAGTYTIAVEAKTAAGTSVQVTQESTGTLISVSFENGYANLHLDNGTTGPAANLIRVNAAGK